MLVYILGLVLFALGICVSVALHEAGHMISAKAFGMKVRRYFIGFGPKVFSFHRGGTEYGLKWIPLGGFCDIAGMTTLDEVTPDESPRAMWRFKTWKRTVVMASGAIVQFILGFVILYLLAVTSGLPNLEAANKPVIGELSECVRSATTRAETNNPECRPTDPAPAKEGGMLPGDLIVSVGGQPTPTWADVLQAVQSSAGPTTFEVRRDGQIVPLTIDVATVTRPTIEGGVAQAGAIGAAKVREQAFLEYGPFAAIGASVSFTGEMFVRTWNGLLAFPERIPAVVESIFGAERAENTPISVVGATRIGGQLAEAGLWAMFLFLLATLNFFMGVFNLLPLLPLDGGHIAVTWYERVRDAIRRMRGKAAAGPVDYTKLSAVTMVLVLIGGGVVLLTVIADIVNPIKVLD